MNDPVCVCGEPARHRHVIARTTTGRETVASCCSNCDRVSYWYRVPGRSPGCILIDYQERSAVAKRWPPAGWLRRHAGSVVY